MAQSRRPNQGVHVVEAVETVTELPDYIAAIIARLREVPALAELSGSLLITGEMRDLATRRWGIYIGKTGGDESRPYTPILNATIEARCYGPNKYESMRLYRRLKPALEPTDRTGCGFVRAGCAILDIHQTGGPQEMIDPTDDAPFVLSRWRAMVAETPQA
jgi:hypothetical protein